jgi:dihydrofolate synthase/folylpolyglutamate synthase
VLARSLCADVHLHASLAEALSSARSGASVDDVILCAGSLYLVGSARSLARP